MPGKKRQGQFAGLESFVQVLKSLAHFLNIPLSTMIFFSEIQNLYANKCERERGRGKMHTKHGLITLVLGDNIQVFFDYLSRIIE